VRNFVVRTHPIYHYRDQVRENVVGGACGGRGRGEKSVQGFGKKEASQKRVDGRIGLEWILGRLAGGWGWSGFSWLRIGTGGGIL
jgi:hypothetical protein